MSLNLYSEAGNIGEVSTNKGWGDIITALTPLILDDADYENLKDFLTEGSTDEPELVRVELSKILNAHTLADHIRPSVENLLSLMRKAREIAIVSV